MPRHYAGMSTNHTAPIARLRALFASLGEARALLLGDFPELSGEIARLFVCPNGRTMEKEVEAAEWNASGRSTARDAAQRVVDSLRQVEALVERINAFDGDAILAERAAEARSREDDVRARVARQESAERGLAAARARVLAARRAADAVRAKADYAFNSFSEGEALATGREAARAYADGAVARSEAAAGLIAALDAVTHATRDVSWVDLAAAERAIAALNAAAESCERGTAALVAA